MFSLYSIHQSIYTYSRQQLRMFCRRRSRASLRQLVAVITCLSCRDTLCGGDMTCWWNTGGGTTGKLSILDVIIFVFVILNNVRITSGEGDLLV